MNDITLEWFFQIPGLFITGGFLLILIALLVFFVGSIDRSKKNNESNLNIDSDNTNSVNDININVVNENSDEEENDAITFPKLDEEESFNNNLSEPIITNINENANVDNLSESVIDASDTVESNLKENEINNQGIDLTENNEVIPPVVTADSELVNYELPEANVEVEPIITPIENNSLSFVDEVKSLNEEVNPMSNEPIKIEPVIVDTVNKKNGFEIPPVSVEKNMINEQPISVENANVNDETEIIEEI